MGVVAALHAGVLFLIANSLGLVPSLKEPHTVATVIDEPPPPDEAPPPADPVKFSDPAIVYPQDPPPLAFEQEDPPISGPPADESRHTETTGGSAEVQPVIVGVTQDSRYPLSQPPYPPSEVRAGHTGTADIEVYVLPNGRVGDARIVKSTGYELLDQSAMAEAKKKWRLTPATRDGVPFAQWHRLRVTFKLNEVR